MEYFFDCIVCIYLPQTLYCNMKKQTLFAGTFLLFCAASAQTPKYIYGSYERPEGVGKKSSGYLIKGDSTEFSVHHSTKSKNFFTFYDMDMKKTGGFVIGEDEGRRADRYTWFMGNDGKLISLYSEYDRGSNENTVYGKILDRKGKVVESERKLVVVTEDRKKDVGTTTAYFSPDRTKILLMRLPPGKKYDQEEMEFSLFDENFETLYEKKIKFPYKNRQISVTDIMLTNSGRVIIVAHWEPTKEEIRKDEDMKGTVFFKIFGLDPKKDEMEELEFAEKGQSFSFVQGREDVRTGNIRFTGIYRDDLKGKYKGANGIFYFELDPTEFTIENKKFSRLSKDMLVDILKTSESEKAERRAEKAVDKGQGLARYKFIDAFLDAEGRQRVILECQYMVQRCNTDSKGNTTCYYVYYYTNIAEVTLGEGGDVEALMVIPKWQVSTTTAYSSFVTLASDGKLFYIYNDAASNFDSKKVDKKDGNNYAYVFNGLIKKSLLAYVTTVEGKKKPVKKSFVKDTKQNMAILPYSSIRVSPSSVITWANIPKGKFPILMKLYVE